MTGYEASGTKRRMLVSGLFSAVLLTGTVICFICDAAISGGLTWSPIPVSSMAFGWAVLFPVFALEKRGIVVGLLSLSIFIVPYLLLLSRFTGVDGVFSIGRVLAALSVTFLWIIAAVFRYTGKTRRWAALGITCLLAIPFLFILNAALSALIGEAILDVWDVLSAAVLLLLALLSFLCDRAGKAARRR